MFQIFNEIHKHAYKSVKLWTKEVEQREGIFAEGNESDCGRCLLSHLRNRIQSATDFRCGIFFHISNGDESGEGLTSSKAESFAHLTVLFIS